MNKQKQKQFIIELIGFILTGFIPIGFILFKILEF